MLKKKRLQTDLYKIVLFLISFLPMTVHPVDLDGHFFLPGEPQVLRKPSPPEPLPYIFTETISTSGGSDHLSLITFYRFMDWIEDYFLQGKFREYSKDSGVTLTNNIFGINNYKLRTVPNNNHGSEKSGDSSDEQSVSEKENSNDESSIKSYETEKALNKDTVENHDNSHLKQALMAEVKSKDISSSTIDTNTIPEGYPYVLVWNLIVWMDEIFTMNNKEKHSDDFFEILKLKDPALDIILKVMINKMHEIDEINAYITKTWIKYILINNNISFDVDKWLSQDDLLPGYLFTVCSRSMIESGDLTKIGTSYAACYGIDRKTIFHTRVLSTTDFSSRSLWQILLHFYNAKKSREKLKKDKAYEFEVLFDDDPLFSNAFIPILYNVLSATSNGLHNHDRALLVLWIDQTMSEMNLNFNWRQPFLNYRFAHGNDDGCSKILPGQKSSSRVNNKRKMNNQKKTGPRNKRQR